MILAIDPGKMSGVAIWHPDRPYAITSYELTPPNVVYLVLRNLERYEDCTVVTEKFTISERTLKTALSLDALDINGWLTLESQRQGFELVVQTPAQAKKFATDDKLKALGWFERTKDGHANDAARHCLVYLINKRPLAREQLIPLLAKDMLS